MIPFPPTTPSSKIATSSYPNFFASKQLSNNIVSYDRNCLNLKINTFKATRKGFS